ncbi:hypothetical protein O1611_g8576 [Lasiodiplodia mahajangana]|uniref:Uncharacterized protein n=1 Tax=Lasiodiplodia mahajangana TaxID=1108764 RepID=A0ACC2JCH2_9PEZI|nr:hypothetical protein O1611_g8576 [Lasiodiplodia mahajangana]
MLPIEYTSYDLGTGKTLNKHVGYIKNALGQNWSLWRHRLGNWLRGAGRSRSQASAEETETQSRRASDAPALTHQTDRQTEVVPDEQHDQTETSSSALLEPPDAGDIPVLVSPILRPTSPMLPKNEIEDLWKEAYEALRKEERPLIEHYEMVLKDQSDIPQNANLRDQLAKVAENQRSKVENRQWKFHCLGKEISMRETVEQILTYTTKATGLISIGVNQAPPYVSIPWSAVTALIPLMMNDINEHKSSISGLKDVAKLTLKYQIAEETFLGQAEKEDVEIKSRYKAFVMDLYKKIIEYQARAVEYFGKSTLRRLGVNTLAGSTEWADMPATLLKLDQDALGSSLLLGLKIILKKMKELDDEVKRLAQRAAVDQDRVTQITNWVSTISFQSDHSDVRDKLGEDHFSSGQWYFGEQKTKNWRAWAEGSRCLWLRGAVGTGKSSLISILFEELVRSPDGLVTIFYCSRKADGKPLIDEKLTYRNDYKNILRSLVSQVAVAIDGVTVHDGVVTRFNQDPRRTMIGGGLTDTECAKLLKDIFSSNSDSHFSILIDALDECTDYCMLLKLLKDAIGSNNNVRIAFTSRFQVKGEEVVDFFPNAAVVTILSQNANDVESYLDIEIPKRRAGCGMTDLQAAKLRKLLVDKANGMFMWVKLQLNLILDRNRAKRLRLEGSVQEKLDRLDASEATGEDLLYSTYDDVYDAAIGRNGRETGVEEIVKTALCWVLCALRPLTLRELAYATSIRQHGRITSTVQEGRILEFCSNLLIEDAVGIVRFPHLSVQHYLETKVSSDFNAGLAHLRVSRTCLYFANSSQFHEIRQSNNQFIQKGHVTLTKTFFLYVSAYWPRHCRQASKTEELNRLIKSFTVKSGGYEHAHRNRDLTEIPGTGENPKSSVEPGRRPLSSLAGSPYEIAAQCVALGSDLGARDSSGRTLLHEAIGFRELETARLLIGAGAPLDAQDYLGNTPMHIASMGGFSDGCRQLLLATADRNSRNLRGETPLHVAVMFGAQEIVEILLSANVDALARDHQGNTVFHYAAVVESLITLETLLLMGHDPDGINQNGDTAVSLAIQLGNKTLVEMLLKHNAVLTERDRDLAASPELPEINRLVSEYNPTQLPPVGPEISEGNDGHVYSVDFGDSASTCRYCDITRWLLASRTGADYLHYQSIQDLNGSAEEGCPLCSLFKSDLALQHDPKDSYPEGRLRVSIDPSSTQGSRMDRKDKLVLYSGDTPLLTYELCVDRTQGSLPTLDWLTGTMINELPFQRLPRLSTIRSWIDDCDFHTECSGDAIPPLPTRVLDVGEDLDTRVRLVSTEGRMGKYLFLSHDWDDRRSKPFTTTTSSLSEFHAGIDIETLPAALRNAVFITRALGLRKKANSATTHNMLILSSPQPLLLA